MRILLLILLFSTSLFAQNRDKLHKQKVKVDKAHILHQVGEIFNETSFASTSNFPITGSSITRGTNKLDMTGSPTLFGSYVLYDNSSNDHRYTGMENWKQRVRVKTPSTINGTSYGIGIGVQSANTFDPYTTTMRWSFDTGGPGALGSLYLYNKLTTAGQVQGVGSFAPAAATYYWIEIERNKNAFSCRVFSDQGTKLYDEAVSFSLSSSYNQAHNVGRFVIHHFGGNAIEVTNWEVSSSTYVGADYCVIGDSNTYGIFATTNYLRWAEDAMNRGGKTFSINAGIADRTADVILKLPEIIALQPRKVLLSIGRNDVANSVALGTIQANIDTIIDDLEAAGIEVELCGVIASNFNVSSVQSYYSGKPNTQVDFYTATKSGTTTLNASYDSGDTIHLNVTGNDVLADLVDAMINP
jgi:lysophospholipase L1-like esterase